ncbi:MAG: ABC transporter ATP-binding protein [Pirellulaceae bacterium]|nr:ABC transporter ATP-binding protein [Pirellulaceae bacterium]
MNSDIGICLENVSKKYCRRLRTALWYGVTDIAAEFAGRGAGAHRTLRQSEFWAVDEVSFTVKQGECIALVGPNGAGKSTILKMINGLIKPDTGRLVLRRPVGSLIELGTGFNPVLTGRENIYVNASILGLSRKQVDARMDEILEFAQIGDFIDAPVRSYSSGMTVRLGFSVAAHLRPQVLLIDEVLAVGDVAFRMKCFRHILSLIDSGTSIIVVSHSVNLLSRVTNRALVMDRGRLCFDGELSEGSAYYQALVSPQIDETGCVTDQGKTRISSVELLDEKGTPCREFSTGDTLRIRMKFSTTEQLPRARISVNLESPMAGLLAGISTPVNNFVFDITPPETVVELQLPNLPLLVGNFLVSVTLYAETPGDFVDRRSPACAFMITGPKINSFGFGRNHIFHLEHQWNLADS